MKVIARDIGSSFYQLKKEDWEMDVLLYTKDDLTIPFTYYYSGRNAILAILKKITSQQLIDAIWLPSYYCDTVINLINSNFDNINYYEVNPFIFDKPVNISSFSNKNDIVILNNYWGLSSFNYQTNNTERPIIIEDHSHGWLSKQSQNSKADYCICSLRKTYPIPLGAIVWKPNSNESLNYYKSANDVDILNALELFNTSMTLKRQFIKNNNEAVKEKYLTALNEGENLLNASNSFIKPSKGIIALMDKYIPLNPNQIKLKHLNYIFKHLDKSKCFQIINRQEFVPFGFLLLFKDSEKFQSFKAFLISNHIYPAHLWPKIELNSQWKYLLNIHVDFRYDIEDMRYLVEKINLWSKNNV